LHSKNVYDLANSLSSNHKYGYDCNQRSFISSECETTKEVEIFLVDQS